MSSLVPETSFVYGASGPENIYNTTPTGLGLSPSYLAASSASATASGGGSGSSLTTSQVTSPVSSAGRSFAAGVNLFPVGLTFFADGTSSYLFTVSAPTWGNTTASNNFLLMEYDGTDGGTIAAFTEDGSGFVVPLAAQAIVLPTAGNHTVNARLWTDAGTSTVQGGAGGVSNFGPIVARVFKA